jgi:cytochrome d ubiquinol oxidase subunit I
MDFDPVFLSRLQFGFTISFHIILPAFTIGLASWLAVIEALWLKTGNPAYRNLFLYWAKIFAVSFGMGVVSGVVLSYEIGTNWSGLTAVAGNILGPLLGYEVLTAFFLEAGFLGIMLFGWDRVGPKLHFFATLMVAVGTLLSTFWILAANSWMQTPAGFEIRNGIFFPVDWWEVIFNPSFVNRLLHMVIASYLTTAFVLAGVAAWYLVEKRFIEQSRIMFSMALGLIAVIAPLQIFIGDLHGLDVLKNQPLKLAAIEANWETHRGVPLVLFAIPDEEAEVNRLEIAIPKLASLILTRDPDGEVKGLKEWPKKDRPPVAIVFWTFRVMVSIGFLMAAIGFYGLYLRWRHRLYDTRWFLQVCRLASPTGFIAILAGWYTTEIGRQPYVIYGLLRTSDAVSPVPGASVAASLAMFVVVYVIIFSAGIYYLLRLLQVGPEPATIDFDRADKSPARLLSLPDEPLEPPE